MRNKYNIFAKYDEIDHIDEVLSHINLQEKSKTINDDKVVYRINLSKYELLYLRLACNSGKISVAEK